MLLFAFLMPIFLIFIYLDIRKNSLLGLGTWVGVVLLVIYFFVPFYLYIYESGYSLNFKYLNHSFIRLESFLICFVFLLSYFVSYFFTPKSKLIIYSKVTPQKARKFVFVILLFALFCYFLFFYFYGGFGYVLSNISYIRSGSDLNKSYIGAFFRLFTYYLEFVMFFFFADALYKKYYGGFNRLKDVGICFFIFFVVLFKSYLDGGRGGIIIDFIGLFFVFYWFSGKINISYLLAVLVFSIFIGFFGKTFIFSLYSDSSQNNYFYDILNEIKFFDGVVIEYSHQYLSLLVAVQNDLGGSRLFADFIYWLMKPLKLLGFSVADSIAYYNTYIIKGKWDSEIPPGALAFAYYQGGLIFIPLFGIFLGVFFSKLNSAIINSIQHSKYNGESYALVLSICVILTTYFPFSVVNSDPALFVQWSFCFIILFFVFVFLGVVKFRKIKYK